MVIALPSRCVVVMVLLGAALPAQKSLAEVAGAAAKQLHEQQVPGLSIAIGIGGKVAFEQGYGIADLENEVPARADTVYRLASVSKTITAVAVLQLCAAGKLELDADVRRYVPEYPEQKWPIPVRALLQHRGGVRHYLRGEGESTKHYTRAVDALERFASSPLLHEPGSKYLYSTYGYTLLAAAVEKQCGTTMADYLREHISKPAGAASLQDDDPARLIPRRAQGYVISGGKLHNSALMDGSYKLGGGGMVSSAPDLVRFGIALLDGRLLDEKWRTTMFTRSGEGNDSGDRYALGVGVDRVDGKPSVSHSGAQSRVSTALYMLPEQQIVVAVLCNLERVRPMTQARALAHLIADGQAK